jgi:hypothetical protein
MPKFVTCHNGDNSRIDEKLLRYIVAETEIKPMSYTHVIWLINQSNRKWFILNKISKSFTIYIYRDDLLRVIESTYSLSLNVEQYKTMQIRKPWVLFYKD